MTTPIESNGDFKVWVPAQPAITTVLAGLGEDGKVFKWTGAKDSKGRSGTFYAIAGDHYQWIAENRINCLHRVVEHDSKVRFARIVKFFKSLVRKALTRFWQHQIERQRNCGCLLR